MFIENIGPQLDPDCTRLTRADHTVSTSTGGEYGAGLKACEAGGSDAVPMACNARICSVAAPFHQCLTHGLPGLQRVRRTKTPFLQARPTRVAEIFGCRHASQCITCLGKGWRQPACDAAACAGSSIAVCCFFRRSKPADGLSLQHVRAVHLIHGVTHYTGHGT